MLKYPLSLQILISLIWPQLQTHKCVLFWKSIFANSSDLASDIQIKIMIWEGICEVYRAFLPSFQQKLLTNSKSFQSSLSNTQFYQLLSISMAYVLLLCTLNSIGKMANSCLATKNQNRTWSELGTAVCTVSNLEISLINRY